MIRLMRRLLVAALLTLAPATGHAQAVNTNSAGLAAGGYDLVAYFVAGSAEMGSPDVTAMHDGATYRFMSTANRDRFLADPAKYLPAYGGYCAYGVANGYKVKVDPDAFTIVDGTLYLNYDKGVMKKWRADIPAYIAKGDANWKSLEDSPRK
jgi:hypothetical protein